MIGWILYIIGSIIVLIILLYLSSQYNESKWLLWAMLLLITVSVCSGRWHKHYMPHWNQVKFEHVVNKSSSANNSLRTQVTEYNHHDNGTEGFFSWKHKVQSKPNLATAQDDVISNANKLLNFKIRSTFDPKYNSHVRKTVSRQAVKQLDRHKYVGQGFKIDHTISNK